MIHVLQYIGSLAQGGSQAMIMSIYRNIDRSQIQFDFVIHADGITPMAEEAAEMGAAIYTCPEFKLNTSLEYSRWWNDFFEQHKEYKVVHSHVRSTAATVLKIAKKHGCITIAHSHNTSSGRGFKAVIKSIMQYGIRFSADYYFACSRNAGEWLFGTRVCNSDKFYVVKNAIDSEKYIYDKRVAKQVRDCFGYTTDNIVIGNVGRLAEQKNQGFLIDIFVSLYKSNPNYRMLIVGDGELRTVLEDKIRDYGLEEVVTLAGMRSDVNRMMMAMDVFVFPSKWEGLGIVMIEAQATGCPCVASDNVPKEAKISEIVDYVSLGQPIDCWVEHIQNIKIEERKNMIQCVKKAGYDVADSSKWLSEFYRKILEAKDINEMKSR